MQRWLLFWKQARRCSNKVVSSVSRLRKVIKPIEIRRWMRRHISFPIHGHTVLLRNGRNKLNMRSEKRNYHKFHHNVRFYLAKTQRICKRRLSDKGHNTGIQVKLIPVPLSVVASGSCHPETIHCLCSYFTVIGTPIVCRCPILHTTFYT